MKGLAKQKLRQHVAFIVIVDLQLIKSMKASLVKQAQQTLKQCTGPGPVRARAKATKKTGAHKNKAQQTAVSGAGKTNVSRAGFENLVR